MKFTLLGSGSHEGFPALWCGCPVCRRALELGGRNIRRRAAYAVDDGAMLVDFGPDAHWQMVSGAIDFGRVRAVIFTGSCRDRLDPVELLWRGGAPGRRIVSLTAGGPAAALDRIKAAFPECGARSFAGLGITPTKLTPNAKFELCGYELWPVASGGAPAGGEMLDYVIGDGRGGRILVAGGANWRDESGWRTVAGMRCDAAVIGLDTGAGDTGGHEPDFSHDAQTMLKFRDELLRRGVLSDRARVVAGVIPHRAGRLHTELENYFTPYSVEVGFDGMEILL